MVCKFKFPSYIWIFYEELDNKYLVVEQLTKSIVSKASL